MFNASSGIILLTDLPPLDHNRISFKVQCLKKDTEVIIDFKSEFTYTLTSEPTTYYKP